jgi:hypothetical protein
MRKVIILMIMALTAVTMPGRAQSTPGEVELRGSLNYLVPDFNLYDYAYGVDVEYRNWLWDPVGFALGVGVASWEVHEGNSPFDRSALRDLYGELTTIPVGPSIVFKMADAADWNLTAEAGIRYVFAQSSVHYRRESSEGRGTFDIDNGVIAVVGLDYEHGFGNGRLFFIGAGYQMDLDEGSIQVSDVTNTSNPLEAFFARVGTKILF